MTARKAPADKAAKKQPRRKGRAAGDNTLKEQKAKVAAIVWADGTDEEIASDLAEKAPDWDNWTGREKRKAVELMREFWGHPVAPTLSVERDDNRTVRLTPGGSNATLHVLRQAKAFATNSNDLANERLGDLSTYFRGSDPRGPTSENMSAALAFINGGQAQNPVQSSLLTQMAATHDAGMRALAMAGRAEFAEQHKVFTNLATKMFNLYAKQAETLAKLQRGAEQTVRHVYVDARTQTAINCPPLQRESEFQSHEQYASGPLSASVLGYNARGYGVPMSGDQGSEPLQAARRKGGRSKGE